MPFNGNGTFVLPGPPLEPGEIVSADEHNELRDDMAAGFTDCVTRDGQSPAVANLPMGGFKHTNVGAANTLTNYSRVDQVQNEAFNWLTSVSGTDTITASSSIAPAAYAAGQRFAFIPAGSNTGAATININSLGAKSIKINGTDDLYAGFLNAGTVYTVVYDGTNFQVALANNAGVFYVERFSGDGSEDVFTLSHSAISENYLLVYIYGVYQQKDTYTFSGNTLTFSSPPPIGTDNIEVVISSTLALGETDASQVEYTLPVTGAVTQTVETKLSETVSVKDFGAVGDGVTDDTDAIQAAIDYLDNKGGGQLNFPKGTYGVTATIFVKSNIRLQGDGRPEIKAIDDINGAMIQFGYTTGVVSSTPTNPCTNSELNGFVINANYKVTLKNYPPSTSLGSGVVFVWYKCPYNKIINCEIKSAECGLVEVEDGADFFELRDCQIHDITSYSSATQYQNLINIDGPTSAVIDNNHIYDLKISGYSPTSWGYAIRLHATDNSIVSNNWCDSGYHNILADGRGNLITNNRCTNGQQSNIVLYQNEFFCRYNSVISNYCDNSNRGIFEEDAGFVGRVSDNYIAFNTVRNVNFNITTEGQNTTVFQNNVFNTSGVLFRQFDWYGTTYTPTLANLTNIASSTAYVCQYTKINNVVTVSGKVDLTPTATGAFDLRISVPVSVNNFADSSEGAGTAHNNITATAAVFSQSASKTLRMQGTFLTTGAVQTWWFTATYRIV